MNIQSKVFLSRVACCAWALSCTGAYSAGVAAPTRLVISEPTKIPGASLAPGTYSIRLVDHLQDRYVLEVSNAEGTSSVSRFLAIPDPSLGSLPLGKPIFWRNSGKDVAVRGIRLKGMAQAAAFVFGKEDAAALAQKVGAPVPAIDPASENRAALPDMNDSDRQLVTLWLLSTETVGPGGAEPQVKATKYDGTALMASAKAPATPRMPRTAGHFADALLFGSLFALTGAGVLFWNRRTALRS